MSHNRIRVLYVVENISYGGSERGFGQLSSNLNRDRFKPYIAGHPGGILEKLSIEQKIPFFPINMDRKFNLMTLSQLSNIVAEQSIDIAHSMGSRADFFARMACGRMQDVRMISTIAMLIEGYDINNLRKGIYKFVDCYSSKSVTHFIAVSNAIKKTLIQERKIPEHKISVIYNGVELEIYKPGLHENNGLRQFLGIEDQYSVVGTIGRLVYQKGFKYFLEAAKKISDKRDKIRFIIVGDGPDKDHLKKMAKDSGILPIVKFTGQRFDIPQLMALFDIFVLPSILEGLPRVVIEAMAMGKPIVATDINGVREELVHNRTGLIVPPKDPESLSGAIISILEDKKSAAKLGKAARESAREKFDLKNTVKNIEKLYEMVLS